jgi:hypothetical protein
LALATIFCHLGVLESFIPYGESHKSQTTAMFFILLSNTHCKPVFYIIFIRFLADLGYISAADLILGSSESLCLVQDMFYYEFIFSNQSISFIIASFFFSNLENHSTDDVKFGKLITSLTFDMTKSFTILESVDFFTKQGK